MDDETNRLRDEFLGAFDKPKSTIAEQHTIGTLIVEIRTSAEDLAKLAARVMALCDEMDQLLHMSDQDARDAADKMIGMMKRIK